MIARVGDLGTRLKIRDTEQSLVVTLLGDNSDIEIKWKHAVEDCEAI